jgi:hypothetical protein
MQVFDYLSVIVSVITGLGMTHVLSGVAELVYARKRVRFYWVSLFWMLFLFVSQVQIWWGLWDLRESRAWNFGSFLVLLLYPIATYLPASVVLPSLSTGESVDLREHYYQNHRAFFSLFALVFLVLTALNPILFGVPWLSVPEGLTALLFGLLGVAAISGSPRYHTVLPLLVSTVTVTFILLFALRLQ